MVEKNGSKNKVIKQNIVDSKRDKLVVNGLDPGGVYECSVTTLRSVDGSKPKSTNSLLVSSMTSNYIY